MVDQGRIEPMKETDNQCEPIPVKLVSSIQPESVLGGSEPKNVPC